MRTILIASALSLMATGVSAQTATLSDPTGDFVPGFIGPNNGDLDVTSFSVGYNSTTSNFTIGASFAGAINPATVGFYVIGVNTGTGVLAPFASVGAPNVIFNQAIVIQKNGTGTVGAAALNPSTITLSGNTLSAIIPLSLLPSTGFAPQTYGFNIWPRVGSGNNNQISDFAPDNATLAAGAVPEPTSWALLILGFAMSGAMLRRRRHAAIGPGASLTA